jgi:hypothetical protein
MMIVVLSAIIVPLLIGGFFLWRYLKKRDEERLINDMLEYASYWIRPGTKITHSVSGSVISERVIEDEEDAAKARADLLSGSK